MGSEIGIKGYVVRGKGTCCAEHEWAAVHQEVIEGTPDRAEATEFSTPREAFAVATRFEEARIFAIAEDGTETPLPSYEEALAKLASVEYERDVAQAEIESLRVDPLAALIVEQRRLAAKGRVS